ncbi:MAG: hypothetical protein AMXMBFR6_12380 [Betaproteobacteria bacterium]
MSEQSAHQAWAHSLSSPAPMPRTRTSKEAGRVSHSTAGALLACQRFETAGRVLAYLIAGHRAGLFGWNSNTLVTADRKINDYDWAGHVRVLGA